MNNPDPHPIWLFGIIAGCFFGMLYADNHLFLMAMPAIYVFLEVSDAPEGAWAAANLAVWIAANYFGEKFQQEEQRRRDRDRRE